MSNESNCTSLKVSVKYKLFLFGLHRESFVTVAAGVVDVDFCQLEMKKIISVSAVSFMIIYIINSVS